MYDILLLLAARIFSDMSTNSVWGGVPSFWLGLIFTHCGLGYQIFIGCLFLLGLRQDGKWRGKDFSKTSGGYFIRCWISSDGQDKYRVPIYIDDDVVREYMTLIQVSTGLPFYVKQIKLVLKILSVSRFSQHSKIFDSSLKIHHECNKERQCFEFRPKRTYGSMAATSRTITHSSTQTFTFDEKL